MSHLWYTALWSWEEIVGVFSSSIIKNRSNRILTEPRRRKRRYYSEGTASGRTAGGKSQVAKCRVQDSSRDNCETHLLYCIVYLEWYIQNRSLIDRWEFRRDKHRIVYVVKYGEDERADTYGKLAVIWWRLKPPPPLVWRAVTAGDCCRQGQSKYFN